VESINNAIMVLGRGEAESINKVILVHHSLALNFEHQTQTRPEILLFWKKGGVSNNILDR
jgi:hypothetical protein